MSLPTASPAAAPPLPDERSARAAWAAGFARVRAHSLQLTAGLSAEDMALQSMPEASPTKWHLAHSTWFFETLVLRPHAAGYRPVDARWAPLFNSYYESLGPRHPRPQRGLLSRPSLDQVLAYRRQVDDAVQRFITQAPEAAWSAAVGLLTLGLHHEQQHQELMRTDILHAFSLNPLQPACDPSAPAAPATAPPAGDAGPRWLAFDAGPVVVGHAGPGFAFDNEGPRHTVWLAPFTLADRLVTQGEYADFIADGGYRRPALWLSDGWALAQAQGWSAPAYWLPRAADGSAAEGYERFTPHGVLPLDPAAPVCHLSGYEAAAYAAWAGARLPTEFEWEHAAATRADALHQLHGAAWQWTASAYAPYPGFRPLAGPAAEYNGKFMINQLVLRGSSLATPAGHARNSYRNFFPPAARWQFSGLRLAKD